MKVWGREIEICFIMYVSLLLKLDRQPVTSVVRQNSHIVRGGS